MVLTNLKCVVKFDNLCFTTKVQYTFCKLLKVLAKSLLFRFTYSVPNHFNVCHQLKDKNITLSAVEAPLCKE